MYLAGFICYGVIPYAAPMMIAPIPLWLAIINVFILPISTAFAEEDCIWGMAKIVLKINMEQLLIWQRWYRY